MPAADRLLGTRPAVRMAGLLVAAVVIFGLTMTTRQRASEFISEEVFYEAAHVRAPQNARVAHYLGAIYVETGRCDAALALFETAARVYAPGSRLGRDRLAAQLLCADARADSAAVEELVAELLQAHPGDAYGLALRARSRVDAGELEAAVDDLERALAATRGADRDVVRLLGSVYNRMARHAEAVGLFEAHGHAGLVGCEQYVVGLLGMGVARYPDAFEAVQACLAQHPEAWRLYELRAWLFRASGRLEAFDADVARMHELGAPAEAMERVRGLR
jgi:tetratricopeptide (TPR) repeat protein